ncbi:YybH family protein [Mesorhizobium sp. L-8-3]|uniref:YybH family protein n=1 Tax=Mesorhizobium sp. L-8-3 TaxID=2744522 RepID=UPI0019258A82|nr:nuclear transport factor 2 family protein [Mesorhizobium sp. L-8-3]
MSTFASTRSLVKNGTAHLQTRQAEDDQAKIMIDGTRIRVREVQIMTTEDEVRKASEQFYAALNRMTKGDSGALADIWSHGAAVTAMHPIGGREVGWDAVRASFDRVAQLASDGRVELKDQLIRVAGNVAYETGVEHGQVTLAGYDATIEHRVTNIYQQEGGAWRLVHHHTDTSPAMLDILSRLQPPSG